MQIIVPMAGFGERFRKAGYQIPKTLIEIEKKPVFQHVIDLFPGEKNFLFIVNEEQEKTYHWKERIQQYLPSATVVAIEPHKKGPIWTLLQAGSFISDQEPVTVNYCDFACVWDWPGFRRFVQEKDLDGAIAAYRGFHPHTLHSNYYAYLRCREDGLVDDIQEKTPFTNQPREEWTSSGTYYFKTGSLLKEALEETVRQDLQVRGEYYVSLAYKPLLQKGAQVAPYPVPYFMQWGTPEDVRDFLYWTRVSRIRSEQARFSYPGTLLMPMAGAGSRFQKSGSYTQPKPLIPVGDQPMVIRAAADLPPMEKQIFVLRKEHQGCIDTLKTYYPKSQSVVLERLTEGQASTCLVAPFLDEEPLLIGACDNGMKYKGEDWDALARDPEVSVIVFGAAGYPGAIRNPNAYSWMEVDAGKNVTKVSLKKPLSSLETDFVVTGAFYFRKGKLFRSLAQRMIQENRRTGGEFYVDETIRMACEEKMKVKCLDVSAYLCWGTPEDLDVFQYWTRCFSIWPEGSSTTCHF